MALSCTFSSFSPISFSFFFVQSQQSQHLCTLAVRQGPTEFLLTKVKNASCRIGIFFHEFYNQKLSQTCQTKDIFSF